MRPIQEELRDAMQKYAIRTGDFTTVSGHKTKWYFIGRDLTFRGDCFNLVGEAIVDALKADGDVSFDAVGGLVVGAIPIALAVAAQSGTRAFAVRKEAKDHGDQSLIAGPLQHDDRVLIVEDTATTGGSLLKAVQAVQDFGCQMVGVSVLLDRGGEIGDKLKQMGIPYFPCLGAPDVGFEYGS